MFTSGSHVYSKTCLLSTPCRVVNSLIGPTLRCHVKGHISVHFYLAALPQAGAGASGVGGCPPGLGSQEIYDQGPTVQGPQASSSSSSRAAAAAAAPPRGPGPSASGPLQRRVCPQHLHVGGYERSVCGAEGPWYGQRPDGDSA